MHLNDNKNKQKKMSKCLKMKNRCTAFTRQNISLSIITHEKEVVYLIKEKTRNIL